MPSTPSLHSQANPCGTQSFFYHSMKLFCKAIYINQQIVEVSQASTQGCSNLECHKTFGFIAQSICFLVTSTQLQMHLLCKHSIRILPCSPLKPPALLFFLQPPSLYPLKQQSPSPWASQPNEASQSLLGPGNHATKPMHFGLISFFLKH